MGAWKFNDLIRHEGHRIVCVTYGDPVANVAVECETCNEVLMDYDSEVDAEDNVNLESMPWQEVTVSVQHARDEQLNQFLDELEALCAKYAWDGCDWCFFGVNQHSSIPIKSGRENE